MAILAITLFSVGSPAYSQHMVRDLSGIVTDGHHEPLRGAIVQVHSEALGTVVSYITDRSGRYSFKRLEGDLDYTVWATWNGKQSSIKKLSLFDVNPRQGDRYRSEARHQVAGIAPQRDRYTTPPFITNTTFVTASISSSGFPVTATTSA